MDGGMVMEWWRWSMMMVKWYGGDGPVTVVRRLPSEQPPVIVVMDDGWMVR